MGNVQHQFISFVGPSSPLRLMNEDTFLVVLNKLDVADYMHFTMASRKFNEFFGSNNFVWAQVCEIFARRPVQALDGLYVEDFENMTNLEDNENSVAKILLAAHPGKRLTMDRNPLRPNDKLNVKDKQLVSQFNFKDALKRYYIHFIQTERLQRTIHKYVTGVSASFEVQVKEWDGALKDVWVKADLKKQHPRDFYYHVNFKVNPQQLEKLKREWKPDPRQANGDKVESFVSEFGGRLVVYQNSTVEPHRRPRIISRMPARRLDIAAPRKYDILNPPQPPQPRK